MKKKTGLILAAVGAGAGFLAGRFVEKIITAKDLVDRIEDMGGSDDLEDYLYDRYGENSGEDENEDEDEFYDEDENVEDDTDDDEDENNEDRTPSVKVMEMSEEEFKKFIREL